jgi:hypothetical protein
VTPACEPEECRRVTTDAGPQDGSDQLEATLDEVITHLREELVHGEWPTTPRGKR